MPTQKPEGVGPSILDLLDDPMLFRDLFPGATWGAWRAFLAAVFSLPLPTTASRDLVRRCTGRQALPQVPAREAWVIVGRRGGKSRIAALLAVSLACFREYRAILAHGERGVVMLIASDRKQARVLKGYVAGLLHAVPMLEALIENETTEAIELTNRIAIEIHTASFLSVRGYTVVAAILDEIAFWPTEEAAEPDTEIVRALRPAMATVPGALLVAISSPYARRGELWRAYRDHFGKDQDPVLVWQAPTETMNPAVPADVIQAAREADEASAAAEYGAQFRRDVESFIGPDVLDAAVLPDRHEVPPVSSVRYVAFVDPSGGSVDSMTLAIAHAEKERVILDCVREVPAPCSPDAVVEEFAGVLTAYDVARVTGDRYGGEWPRERFSKHGIAYEVSEQTKSDLYREFLPLVNSRRLDLLDHHPKLLAQLSRLERRTGRGGRDTIDHPPGSHDDLANAVAGAVVRAHQTRQPRCLMFGPGCPEPGQPALPQPEPVPGHDLRARARVFKEQLILQGAPFGEPEAEPAGTCGDCQHFDGQRCLARNGLLTQAALPACHDYAPAER